MRRSFRSGNRFSDRTSGGSGTGGSSGNFVNWTSSSGAGIANRMVGGMAQVTLTEEDDRITITDYSVEPVVCHLEKGTNGVTVYKLSAYTSELAEKNQIRLQDPAFSLEYCQQLCARVWDENYKLPKS